MESVRAEASPLRAVSLSSGAEYDLEIIRAATSSVTLGRQIDSSVLKSITAEATPERAVSLSSSAAASVGVDTTPSQPFADDFPDPDDTWFDRSNDHQDLELAEKASAEASVELTSSDTGVIMEAGAGEDGLAMVIYDDNGTQKLLVMAGNGGSTNTDAGVAKVETSIEGLSSGEHQFGWSADSAEQAISLYVNGVEQDTTMYVPESDPNLAGSNPGGIGKIHGGIRDLGLAWSGSDYDYDNTVYWCNVYDGHPTEDAVAFNFDRSVTSSITASRSISTDVITTVTASASPSRSLNTGSSVETTLDNPNHVLADLTKDATWDTVGAGYSDLNNATVASGQVKADLGFNQTGVLMESGASGDGLAVVVTLDEDGSGNDIPGTERILAMFGEGGSGGTDDTDTAVLEHQISQRYTNGTLNGDTVTLSGDERDNINVDDQYKYLDGQFESTVTGISYSSADNETTIDLRDSAGGLVSGAKMAFLAPSVKVSWSGDVDSAGQCVLYVNNAVVDYQTITNGQLCGGNDGTIGNQFNGIRNLGLGWSGSDYAYDNTVYWAEIYEGERTSDVSVATHGFESGTGPWTSNVDWVGRQSSPGYESDYCFGGSNTNSPSEGVLAEATPSELSGGNPIQTFTHYYFEEKQSYGGGIRLVSSSGNPVVIAGTDNPQWDVIDYGSGSANHTELYAGSNYEDWHKVVMRFDWSASQVEVEFRNLSTRVTRSTTVGLSESDVEKIELVNYGSTTSGSYIGDSNFVHYIDDVSFQLGLGASLSGSETLNCSYCVEWDASGSFDPEGETLEYRFDWENTGNYDTTWSTDAVQEHDHGDTGNATCKVQIRDPDNNKATAKDTVNIIGSS